MNTFINEAINWKFSSVFIVFDTFNIQHIGMRRELGRKGGHHTHDDDSILRMIKVTA